MKERDSLPGDNDRNLLRSGRSKASSKVSTQRAASMAIDSHRALPGLRHRSPSRRECRHSPSSRMCRRRHRCWQGCGLPLSAKGNVTHITPRRADGTLAQSISLGTSKRRAGSPTAGASPATCHAIPSRRLRGRDYNQRSCKGHGGHNWFHRILHHVALAPAWEWCLRLAIRLSDFCLCDRSKPRPRHSMIAQTMALSAIRSTPP
jgi:hypothetical protein